MKPKEPNLRQIIVYVVPMRLFKLLSSISHSARFLSGFFKNKTKFRTICFRGRSYENKLLVYQQ